MITPRLLVDHDAVVHNVQKLRSLSTARGFWAVVKADGFGHGAETVARAALEGGATGLGVTSLAEAAEVQHLGAPVLSWLNSVQADFSDPSTAQVEVAVPSAEHLAAVCRGSQASGTVRRVHLFVDTGMSRDGCPPEDWSELCRQARRAELAGLVRVSGLMGHLGSAEGEDDPLHRAAAARYSRAVAEAGAVGLAGRSRHLSATSAALRTPGAHHDALRVGAGLVGIDPTGSGQLRQASTLVAPIVQVRRVPAGEAVGYGGDHVVPRATWLGLLPLGYADGIPRRASGRASVLVRGQRRPLVGWVSMDQVVVDLGDAPAAVGEQVTVFGRGMDGEPTLAEWAGWADVLEHELVTGISSRVTRVSVREAAAPPVVRPVQGDVSAWSAGASRPSSMERVA